MATATTATPIPIPAFAPLLKPLLEVGIAFPVLLVFGIPVPVAIDVLLLLPLVLVLVLVAIGSPTVVDSALAVGNTINTGLFAPYPAEMFGRRSKLQDDTPCHTSSTSWEPLYG